MRQCNAALLSDRAVVRVSGPAASSFLQGLITNDIDKAKPGGAIHAGLLTPQGKILFDFFVVPAGDGFLLEIAKAKAAELVQRLGFYRAPRRGRDRRGSGLHGSRGLGRAGPASRRRHRLCRSAAAGARGAHPASRWHESRQSRLHARWRGRISRAPHRAWRARGRARLRLWRCLSA